MVSRREKIEISNGDIITICSERGNVVTELSHAVVYDIPLSIIYSYFTPVEKEFCDVSNRLFFYVSNMISLTENDNSNNIDRLISIFSITRGIDKKDISEYFRRALFLLESKICDGSFFNDYLSEKTLYTYQENPFERSSHTKIITINYETVGHILWACFYECLEGILRGANKTASDEWILLSSFLEIKMKEILPSIFLSYNYAGIKESGYIDRDAYVEIRGNVFNKGEYPPPGIPF